MSNFIPSAIVKYMELQKAKARAAEVIGKAICEAEAILDKAGVEESDEDRAEIIQAILEAAQS